MKTHYLCILLLLAASALQAQTYTNFTTIDEPLASAGNTFVQGISGNVVVGYFYNSQGRHGFYHTLGTTNYTTIDVPAGSTPTSFNTGAYGISGNNIVGYYQATNSAGTYGFIYNISTGIYTTFDDPAGVTEGVSSTEAYAIDGNTIVGTESDNSIPAGSVFGFTFGPISGSPVFGSFHVPIPYRITTGETSNATNYITIPYGISGSNVVGWVKDTNSATHGFIYNLSTLSLTLMTNSIGEILFPYGIESNHVVGYFSDPNNGYNNSGFLYTIGSTNLITIRNPLGSYTLAQGISGNAIVGIYYAGGTHGFVVGTPTVIPVISSFIVSGGTYMLKGSNGIPGAAYSILSTTNVLSPMTNWLVVTTNVFGTNGTFTFSHAVGSTPPQMFYRISEAQ